MTRSAPTVLLLLTAALAVAAPVPQQPYFDARFTYDQPVPTLTWGPEEGADLYELEVAVDPGFVATTGPLSVGGLSWTLPISQEVWNPLSLEIFWRVRAVTGSTPGAWSRTMRFSKTRLWAATVYSPSLDTRLGEWEAPFFSWHPTVRSEEWADEDGDGEPDQEPTILYPEGYEVQFAYDQGFGQIIDPPLTIGTDVDDRTFDMASIMNWDAWNPAEFQLWWRLYGVDENGHRGPFSPPRRLNKSTLGKPGWWAPVDRTYYEFYESPPSITWAGVNGAVQYELQFVTDKGPDEILGSMFLQNTWLNLWDVLPAGYWDGFWGSLYFRISAIGPEDRLGPWTDISVFTKKAHRRVLALGDSITGGWGSSHWGDYPEGPWGFDRAGYPWYLNHMLQESYWPAEVAEWWISGGQAWEGHEDLDVAMETFGPEYVIYMFGTVDILDPAGCDGPCLTEEHLREMALEVLDAGATPVLCTVIPPNPLGEYSDIAAPVEALNSQIRDVAQDLGIPLADLWQVMIDIGGEHPEQLYYDGLHPDDDGYWVIADYLSGLLGDLF